MFIGLERLSNLHNFSTQINFDSDNSLHCDMFDVDMKTGEVSCTTGGVPADDEKFSKEETNRETTNATLRALLSHWEATMEQAASRNTIFLQSPKYTLSIFSKTRIHQKFFQNIHF